MKRSVLSSPVHQAQLSKTGFNMSQTLQFTSSTGHLLPVYYDFLHPGEKVKISFDLFTRTQPVTTAALTEVDEYVDLFFVPMKKLNSAFHQLVTNVDDLESSLFDVQGLTASHDNRLFFASCLNPELSSTASGSPDWFGYLNSKYNGISGSTFFENYSMGVIRLTDLLGFNPTACLNFANRGRYNYNPLMSMMYPCAYQAIYYDYYRLSDWEGNNVKAYNVDDLLNGSAAIRQDSPANYFTDFWSRFFKLHYRPYKKDYLKAIHPSPLLGSNGLLDNALYQPDTLLQADSQAAFYSPLNSVGTTVTPVNTVSLDSYNNFILESNQVAWKSYLGSKHILQALSTTNIRGAFAMEKLLRITGEAGRHYDDQVLAHYGFKVPQGISNEVYFIGSHHQVLTIGEVLSTAATADAVIGTPAGRGWNKGSSKDMTFTAPAHGIIMAIYSAVPRQVYTNGIDKQNAMINYYDIYHPEFDKLGMQPLWGYESRPSLSSNMATTAYGWQYRYQQFKCKYNRASGAFGQRVTLSPQTQTASVNLAPFRDWTNADVNMVTEGVDNLYCSPLDLNKIMAVSFNRMYQFPQVGEQDANIIWENMYATDPLIHQLRVSAFKVSTMSTFGIENL